MKKLQLFLSNIIVYGFGGIISKLIPLIMIPLIIRILPDTVYFGLNDQTTTLTSITHAISVFGMYDALYRLYFEKDDIGYQKSICSTALGFSLVTSFAVSFVLILFRVPFAKLFFKNEKYIYLVYICSVSNITGATTSIIAAPTRMQNKRITYLAVNLLMPFLTYSIAIFFLLRGKYTTAIPMATLASGLVSAIIYASVNQKWFNLSNVDWTLLKPLLNIGAPLLPISLVYWVFNSCDKLMITNMLGLGAEGVYAVGSKLGHLSQLIYMAFAGGWQFFAFSTMKDENQVKNNSMVFEYLGILSYIATMFVCAWAYPLFQFLFTAEYLKGFVIAPYLFLSPLLLMLYQVIGNQFLVVKKTWPSTLILTFGALTNVGLNLLLIPRIGIEGASIATLAGYIITVIVCSVVLYKMHLMIITIRFLISSALITAYVALWRLFFSTKPLVGTCVAILGSILLSWLYRYDIKQLLALISIAAKQRGEGNDDSSK